MAESVENEGKEAEKQDCEQKACFRMIENLKQEFPCLLICLSADSLYVCGAFFEKCREKSWRYLLRFKEGSIPTAYTENESICRIAKNRREESKKEQEQKQKK